MSETVDAVELRLALLARAYGLEHARFSAFPTSLFLTLGRGEAATIEPTKRLSATPRLDQIAAVHGLAEEAERGRSLPGPASPGSRRSGRRAAATGRWRACSGWQTGPRRPRLDPAAVPDDQVGAASGISNMARYIGGSVVVAAVATIFNWVTVNRTNAGASASEALADGLSRSALLMAVCAGLGIAIALLMARHHQARRRRSTASLPSRSQYAHDPDPAGQRSKFVIERPTARRSRPGGARSSCIRNAGSSRGALDEETGRHESGGDHRGRQRHRSRDRSETRHRGCGCGHNGRTARSARSRPPGSAVAARRASCTTTSRAKRSGRP